ncbi:hypothetical protein D3C71_1879020 [compost metagenome]
MLSGNNSAFIILIFLSDQNTVLSHTEVGTDRKTSRDERSLSNLCPDCIWSRNRLVADMGKEI